MKLRRKWIIGAAVVVLAGLIVGAVWWHRNTPQARARRLVSELRQKYGIPPGGKIERLLTELRPVKRRALRERNEIDADLVQLGRPGVQALIEALEDEDDRVHTLATSTLPKFGALAMPDLIQAMEHSNRNVRGCSAYTLGLIGPEAEEAVPVLIKALKPGRDGWVRTEALGALVKIRASGEGIIPLLTELLGDEDEWMRIRAANALVRLGHPERVLPVLI